MGWWIYPCRLVQALLRRRALNVSFSGLAVFQSEIGEFEVQMVAAVELNEDYLDATDHIAYQFSNLIQPHVLFFNVERPTRKILNVSTGVGQRFGCDAGQLIGRSLTDELFPGISSLLEGTQADVPMTRALIGRVTDVAGQALWCRVVSTADRWMIELEVDQHASDVSLEAEHLQRLVLEAVYAFSEQTHIQKVIDRITCQLRELLGFQRSMCYRFDEDSNGEVIAECTAGPEVKRYLGMKFPSRDIPRTARQMLMASAVRTTLDQCLDCDQIIPARDPVTHEYLDLTHIRSRGAAGSCREFYLNMNIRSTYVLPLMVNDRLWGLLSLHDDKPRRVKPVYDEQLQCIAKCLSIAIENDIRVASDRTHRESFQIVDALSQLEATSDQWLQQVGHCTGDLQASIPCNGFMLRLSGEVFVSGAVPDAQDQRKFVDRLWEMSLGKPLAVSRLADFDERLAQFKGVAAGAIAIPLATQRNDIAIWLRPEQKQTVRWAGDPLSNWETDDRGRKRLNVRDSFELWTRITENACLPWTEDERAMASAVGMQLGLLALSWYAAQANQAKTRFLSCMSHEIRTPMTAILGYATLLKEHQSSAAEQTSQSDSEMCEFIDVIERNGQHLLAVIDDILNLAKIEAGKLVVEQITIDLPKLLADVCVLAKVHAEKKKLDFLLEAETEVPQTIQSDPVRLRQILLNLLSNAFKFTEQGRVRLKVGNKEATGQLCFEVIDSGIGLTDSQISHLFGAFVQADSSTTRKFGGSGLGLQISKNLAQLLGGDITVESEPGVGSTFRVTIATGSSCDAESGVSTRTLSADQTREKSPLGSASLNGVRILLIEDGEDNQRLLKRLLNKAGADVQLCANGKLAIESLTTDGELASPLRAYIPFDIILTDMQMPELDGYSTTRLLRAKGCGLPIIALTAFAMEGNDKECLEAGCNAYLSKPIDRQSLIETCVKWSHHGL